MAFKRKKRHLIYVMVLLLSGCATDSQKPTPTQNQAINEQAQQLLRLGTKTQESGDLANAIGFYQRAYSLVPNDIDILLTLSAALSETGDQRTVEQLYRNALSAHPENTELLRRHANSLILLDRLAQARIQLQKALKLAPNDPKIHNSLGVTLDLQGQHDQAQTHYQQVSDLSGINNLALSLALQGNYDQALDILAPYENDLNLEPRYRLNLALIYGLKGDEKAAARVAAYVLDREAVDHNLAIYKSLRDMASAQRAKEILTPAP